MYILYIQSYTIQSYTYVHMLIFQYIIMYVQSYIVTMNYEQYEML